MTPTLCTYGYILLHLSYLHIKLEGRTCCGWFVPPLLSQLVTASLYHIYSALEEEIERNKEHPAYAPVYFPAELHRKDALEQDLEYFYGPVWREEIPCSQATQKYVERIHYVGQHEPETLVAHAYTRYLGDLSGGQVLKKIAQKALQLPVTGEGLAFFTFDGVSSATKFKQLYRSRMNSIEMDPATKDKVLEEAKNTFLLNIQVSNQPAMSYWELIKLVWSLFHREIAFMSLIKKWFLKDFSPLPFG